MIRGDIPYERDNPYTHWIYVMGEDGRHQSLQAKDAPWKIQEEYVLQSKKEINI